MRYFLLDYKTSFKKEAKRHVKKLFRLLKIRLLRGAGYFAKLLYSSYCATIRIEEINSDFFPQNFNSGRNAIYAFWHSKTFLLLPYCRNTNMGILTLFDWKNLIYDKISQLYGYQTVPVTSPQRAAVRLKKLLEKGDHIGIAMDGPHGPAGHMKPGVIFLAKTTGVPIITMDVRVDKSFRINTRWDRFEIPMPFTRATISLSAPIRVTENNENEVEKAILSSLKDL